VLVVSTDKGLRKVRLVDLKFHTKVKDWICNTANHIYNFDNEKLLDRGYISNTVCSGLTKVKFNKNYKLFDDSQLGFDKNFGVCPMENCHCGYDIWLPKGRTKKDIENLIDLVQCSTSEDQLKNLPEYDNTEKILAFGASEFIKNMMIHIDWYLSKRCNFDCYYCPPTIHDNISPYPTLEKLKNDYKFITDTVISREENLKNKKVDYVMHGGEPTIIPHYFDLLDMINTDTRFSDVQIRTLTNLTGNIKKLYKLNTLCDVTFSVHLAYMNDKFLNKLQNFLSIRDDKCKTFKVKFMYDKEYKNMILKMIDIISPYKNLDYEVMALHKKASFGGGNKLYEYSDEDKPFFKLRGSL
jgi:organic radical activating enzyme